jgi:hypothetical protein
VEIVRPDKLSGLNGNRSPVGEEREPLLLTFRGHKADSAVHAESDEPAKGDALPFEQADTGERVGVLGMSDAARQLTLRQKLAEVRRRIRQIEKRGVNEEGDYRYVKAADLADAVGDVLAELGVILLPRLESISSESLGERAGQQGARSR